MAKSSPQSSLFDQPAPGSNTPEYSVGEIARLVKKTIEDSFGNIRVRGEISECKLHSNGHIYLTLKDEEGVLAAVCWRGQAGKLAVKPQVGLEVVVSGRLTTYGGQSKYQLVIETMALAGIGALLKLLEERKKKLAAEGLFDAERKKALPYLPSVIGVVTSPTGAVIRDILHRLADRFPRPVLVWPTAVQGEGAAAQIVEAIEGFNRLPLLGPIRRPDVLIVARGGGSVEDLMPFNEENVVRAVAASAIPIISAVGHETDTTLIDYVSDRRAPTPTAAAEMAVPVRADLMMQVAETGLRLTQTIRRVAQMRRERLDLTGRALGDPARAIEPLAQRADDMGERLEKALRSFAQQRRSHLNEYSGRLRTPRDRLMIAAQRLQQFEQRRSQLMRERMLRGKALLERLTAELGHLSPRAVLGRGYVIVHDDKGGVVTRRDGLQSGQTLALEFADGKMGVGVE